MRLRPHGYSAWLSVRQLLEPLFLQALSKQPWRHTQQLSKVHSWSVGADAIEGWIHETSAGCIAVLLDLIGCVALCAQQTVILLRQCGALQDCIGDFIMFRSKNG